MGKFIIDFMNANLPIVFVVGGLIGWVVWWIITKFEEEIKGRINNLKSISKGKAEFNIDEKTKKMVATQKHETNLTDKVGFSDKATPRVYDPEGELRDSDKITENATQKERAEFWFNKYVSIVLSEDSLLLFMWFVDFHFDTTVKSFPSSPKYLNKYILSLANWSEEIKKDVRPSIESLLALGLIKFIDDHKIDEKMRGLSDHPVGLVTALSRSYFNLTESGIKFNKFLNE